ncbi:hypothetical protein ASE59_06165 [Sphingomonas sp. Leaf10]|nr:hypothetical protein ASE59_06165 [Sphingomonas sp. Leaf10]
MVERPRHRVARSRLVGAGGTFPLFDAGQEAASPCGICGGVGAVDMDDRVLPMAVGRAARSLWMTPVGTFHEPPPVRRIVERHRFGRGHEHRRAAVALGAGAMAGGCDEGGELEVGHFMASHLR